MKTAHELLELCEKLIGSMPSTRLGIYKNPSLNDIRDAFEAVQNDIIDSGKSSYTILYLRFILTKHGDIYIGPGDTIHRSITDAVGVRVEDFAATGEILYTHPTLTVISKWTESDPDVARFRKSSTTKTGPELRSDLESRLFHGRNLGVKIHPLVKSLVSPR